MDERIQRFCAGGFYWYFHSISCRLLYRILKPVCVVEELPGHTPAVFLSKLTEVLRLTLSCILILFRINLTGIANPHIHRNGVLFVLFPHGFPSFQSPRATQNRAPKSSTRSQFACHQKCGSSGSACPPFPGQGFADCSILSGRRSLPGKPLRQRPHLPSNMR